MTYKIIPAPGDPYAPKVGIDVVRVAKVSVGSPGSTAFDVVLSGEIAATPIFSVGANVMVHDLLAKVVTAYTASAAFTVGDSDDVDGYMAAVDLICTVISSELRSSKSSTTLATVYGMGKIYSAAQTIDVTAGATFAVGQMDCYLLYSVVST